MSFGWKDTFFSQYCKKIRVAHGLILYYDKGQDKLDRQRRPKNRFLPGVGSEQQIERM